jgi:hypothetical protein
MLALNLEVKEGTRWIFGSKVSQLIKAQSPQYRVREGRCLLH